MRELTDDEGRIARKLYLEKLEAERLGKDPVWRWQIHKRLFRLIQGGKRGGLNYD